jgi:hypothetical protein
MKQRLYMLTFSDIADDLVSQYADELKDMLLDISPDIEIERKRDDRYSQDLGNFLQVTIPIATPSTVIGALAGVIVTFLKLRRIPLKITQKRGIGIKISNLKNEETVVRIIQIYLENAKRDEDTKALKPYLIDQSEDSQKN